MKIELINHASVIFKCGETKILTDPWYCESPFNNGWSLLVEKDIDINALDFNYLWYSHEHPDHFSIADIKKISEDRKKEITILFQKTPDQKVKGFCEKLGFKVKELEPMTSYELEDGVIITCGIEGGFDSWISVSHEGKTALNINDCRVEEEEELNEIKDLIGDVDVLLTQFSWANWVGNSGDENAIEISRGLVHYRVDNQIKFLNPDYIIPFASFTWFSHEENSFCNHNAITVKEFVDRYPNENMITLYLGDEWEVGNARDCSEAVATWMDVTRGDREPKHKSKTVPTQDLLDSFAHMKSKIQKDNDWQAILDLHESGDLEDCVVHLTDTDQKFLFNITGYTLTETSKPWDIQMGSESFNYLMRHAWGRGTLMINGRFQANYKTLYRFLRQTHIYYGNNIGKTYPIDIKPEEIINPKCFVFETIGEINNER